MVAAEQTSKHESFAGSFRWMGEWWLVLLGYLLLYVPTYARLASDAWISEHEAHGPFILAIVLAMFWYHRADVAAQAKSTAPWTGILVLTVGLLFYMLGRSQHILMFEAGSQLPVITGLVLIFKGWDGIKRLWFPILYLVFMVPLPGFLIDSLTNPLKQEVSVLVADWLYALGYPIARDGVILAVGPYHLLVADACSGLNSMFSLSAMGLLYLYIVRHKSWLRNAVIVALILPISFVANIIRVIILVLLTYHFGDEVGQGFLHDFAGLFLFMTALLGVFLADSIIGGVVFLSRRFSTK